MVKKQDSLRGVRASARSGPARLASGGLWGFWMGEGHYEVTQDVVERFGFSTAAVDILRDASQDPDFYEFTIPPAHAQSADHVAFLPLGAERDQAEEKAIQEYKAWVLDKVSRLKKAAMQKNIREALYWLGYMLHGIEDLAPHGGITNAEHASLKESPDNDENHIALAGHYALEFLRNIREILGNLPFDSLRNWDGEGSLFFNEKAVLLGKEYDLSLLEWGKYKQGGKTYLAKKPAPIPVRWPRERVFTNILEEMAPGGKYSAGPGVSAVRGVVDSTAFDSLGPATSPWPTAGWTIMVFMAGDDANPNGIEYAISQDLTEIKRVGSTEDVHFLAQTDGYRQKNSYRYRLRRGTSLEADRLGLYRGDLNTGKIGTLVDFVRWSKETFPAKRYALILWGHGSGHDDQDIYRLARGTVSPRLAARLAARRLGFFGRTRRAMLERQGPNKGYGFDSTAADFLDNREMKKALKAIAGCLGQPLDLLGFDACLMANMEVAYQIGKNAKFLVASEETEPGDGWLYTDAFKFLPDNPAADARELGIAIVRAYEKAYRAQQTLSLIDQTKIPVLGKRLRILADTLGKADMALFHQAQVEAMNFSPAGSEGYRDLGAFITAVRGYSPGDVTSAAEKAQAAYRTAVVRAAGAGTGLTIYLPGNYRPYLAGSTDALYQLMDFPMQCGWSRLLESVYRSRSAGVIARRTGVTHVPPRFGSLFGMDRHNVQEIIQSLTATHAPRNWMDLSRRNILSLPGDPWSNLLKKAQPNTDLRIFILPGIMGSQLSDRSGPNGLLWIDPLGLAVGSDFDLLRCSPDGMNNADPAIRIDAAGPVPIVYDRLAVALMLAFGRCVDYLAYDWRLPISTLGHEAARRLVSGLAGRRDIPIVLVAHAMGGLVAAKAMETLKTLNPAVHNQIRGLIAMGTPWRGYFKPVQVMTGQSSELQLFSRLTHRSREETASVLQTFWGLSDMIPADRADLLDPRLYTPGPLASSLFREAQMASAQHLAVVPPKHTLAIVCDTRTTITDFRRTGTTWEMETGPGDGTVPLWSATAGSAIETVVVNEEHMALPLDGNVISHAIDRIGAWTGRRTRKVPTFAALDAVAGSPPAERAALMASLERMDDAPLPFGVLKSLMLLA